MSGPLMTGASPEIGRLMDALGLKRVTEFKMEITANNIVTVDAQMYLEVQDLDTVFKSYVLVEKDVLKKIIGLLGECSGDYNYPHFTDRHQMGPRLKEMLDQLSAFYERLG